MPSGLIDLLGRTVLPCKYDYLQGPWCGLLVCYKNDGDKAGYINVKGEFVIPPKFDVAYGFDAVSGCAAVEIRGSGPARYGLINRAGEWVMQPKYAHVHHQFREGLRTYSSYEHHELYGYADAAGNVVISPKFDYGCPFSCGLAAVTSPDSKGQHYFIDRSGRRVLGPYEGGAGPSGDMSFSSDGIARVCDPGKQYWYYINPAGQVLLKPDPKIHIEDFRDGLAISSDPQTGKFGYRDISGGWAIEPQFDEVGGFWHGYAHVKVEKKWGLIDKRGRKIVPPEFPDSTSIGYPSCGRISFADKNSNFGFLSLPTGKVVIPAKFTGGVDRFYEGYAVVRE